MKRNPAIGPPTKVDPRGGSKLALARAQGTLDACALPTYCSEEETFRKRRGTALALHFTRSIVEL